MSAIQINRASSSWLDIQFGVMMRSKMAIAIVVSSLVVLALTSCSAISEGYITKKTFTPSHTSTWIWCHPVGKATFCQPMTTFHGDAWEFDIQKDEDTGFVSVTEEEYNSYEVGDYYPAQ